MSEEKKHHSGRLTKIFAAVGIATLVTGVFMAAAATTGPYSFYAGLTGSAGMGLGNLYTAAAEGIPVFLGWGWDALTFGYEWGVVGLAEGTELVAENLPD